MAGTFALPNVVDQPGQLTLGPDGNTWVVLGGGSNDVARVTPSGTVTPYAISGVNEPVGIAAGPDGNLWVTQPGAVVRFSPASPTTAQTFAQPAITVAEPITTGPDGNLWTASGATVLQIPPANPVATQSFTVPGMSASAISATSDSIWIAEAAASPTPTAAWRTATSAT